MARWLFPLAGRVVLTSVAQDRAASPRALARMAGTLARGAVLAATPSAAMARARALAGPRGRVVVAGSLFLVGDVLALSRRRASAARRRRRSRRAGS